MTSKSYIILGEAPESESEEEVIVEFPYKDNDGKHVKGKVVGGEAPESDEDSNGFLAETRSLESVSSAMSASSIPSLTGDGSNYSKKSSSLLVKILCERNYSLHKNTQDFVINIVTSAGNELNSTNQQLLKCQVQVQEAADIMKGVKCNLAHLDNNLQSLISVPFLPDIKIETYAEIATPSNEMK